METNIATFIDKLPPHSLYVHVRSPFLVALKRYPWFALECEYKGTWDTEFVTTAYLVPFERLLELYNQGDPELFLFMSIGR